MSKTLKATPHIQVTVYGLIAKTVLMPGDPLRAKYIAETFLEDVTCFNEVRGMYGFTGTYKGGGNWRRKRATRDGLPFGLS